MVVGSIPVNCRNLAQNPRGNCTDRCLWSWNQIQKVSEKDGKQQQFVVCDHDLLFGSLVLSVVFKSRQSKGIL
ncbi:hypothetical protein HAX54_008080, partial [Datura stramonium]|nr:hypothetical protein [Datura stramonium]